MKNNKTKQNNDRYSIVFVSVRAHKKSVDGEIVVFKRVNIVTISTTNSIDNAERLYAFALDDHEPDYTFILDTWTQKLFTFHYNAIDEPEHETKCYIDDVVDVFNARH